MADTKVNDTEERKQELEAEAQDALDFGDADYEDPEAPEEEKVDEDQPWDEDEKPAEEEQKSEDEPVGDQEVEEEEVATEAVDEEGTDEEDGVEVDEDGVETYTLDGKKYTAEEIVGNPKLMTKLATHYNQVGNFQKRDEEHKATIAERDVALAKAEDEKQKLYNEWTRMQLANEQKADEAAEAEAAAAEAPPPRPTPDVLKSQLEPYIKSLREGGRLTDDEVDEHSGLIAEYIYDTLETRKMIEGGFAHFVKKIDRLENFINPAVKSWDKEQAERSEISVQEGAAAIEGYEALADPEKWDELKAYITRKIQASPKDSEGNPTFDPIFDAETMAEQFDAMEGKAMRAILNAKKKKAKTKTKADAKKAGGSTTSGGKTPKKRPKPKKPLTEEDAALEWGTEGRMAGG